MKNHKTRGGKGEGKTGCVSGSSERPAGMAVRHENTEIGGNSVWEVARQAKKKKKRGEQMGKGKGKRQTTAGQQAAGSEGGRGRADTSSRSSRPAPPG